MQKKQTLLVAAFLLNLQNLFCMTTDIINCIAQNENEEVIIFLQTLGNFEITDLKHGRTALHWCAVKGNLLLAQYLIENKKVNPNAIDKFKNTPLILAVKNQKKVLTEYLLRIKNMDIEAKDYVGWTALMHAAKFDLQIVEMLVAAGAKIDVVDNFGNTPIKIAIQNKKSEIEEFLQKKIKEQDDNFMREQKDSTKPTRQNLLTIIFFTFVQNSKKS